MTTSSGNSSTFPTMTQSSLPSHSQKSCIFEGEIENIQSLVPVLKSISIKRMAVMAITNVGWKISCEEDSRTIQATAFIDINQFVRYEMSDESSPTTLCFQMSDLLNSISILLPTKSQNRPRHPQQQQQQNNQLQIQQSEDSNVSLKIKFENIDRLKLMVVNGNHSAMAYIQTYHPHPLVVFSMSFVNKIVLDPTFLIDFWKCSDTISPRLRIKILDADPWFEIGTESERGKFFQTVKAQSPLVEHYECTVPMEEYYEMKSMHFTLRPLLLASKVSIRMDSNGLLNMQFAINLEDKNNSNLDEIIERRNSRYIVSHQPQQPSQASKPCFVEFYIVPCIV